MTGIIGFVIGVVATLLFQKWWKDREDKKKDRRPVRTTGRGY